jgi:single-strand DNA-binding protein
MASFNRITLVGNLVCDPVFKQVAAGQPLCRLRLATNRSFKKHNGDMAEEKCYMYVNVWGPQAASCNQCLKKGSHVLVEGRVKLESWKDKNGQERNQHLVIAENVVFLSPKETVESNVNKTLPAASDLDLQDDLFSSNQLPF